MILLGSTRETIDVDYAIEKSSKEFEDVLKKLSDELRLDLENVPLQEFIPLSKATGERHHFVGRYGKVNVYVFDPYSIALSKLDRGFDTDIEDIIFLIQRGLVTLPLLEKVMQDAIPRAQEFDMNASDMQRHLQAVRKGLE